MAPKMAWATQVDAEEADGAEALPALPAAFAEPTAFPSLGDAVKVQETKAEKKKRAQKMTLSELHNRCAPWVADALCSCSMQMPPPPLLCHNFHAESGGGLSASLFTHCQRTSDRQIFGGCGSPARSCP